ncbi:MAG: nucleotide pyrophosphohydrolase [Frankiaceae bacterium]
MSGRHGLDDVMAALDAFVAERNWAQFHSPKNLVMALTVEVGELNEHFMWLDAERSDRLSGSERDEVAAEIGDVLIYLLHLCRRLGIDPVDAAAAKLDAARAKYPAERFRVPDGRHD